MAHQKEGCLCGEVRFDKGGDVCENLGSWACETLLGRFLHGATPAALVEGVDLNRAGGQLLEEGAVGSVAVVAETMDKDEDCDGRGSGLKMCWETLALACHANGGSRP